MIINEHRKRKRSLSCDTNGDNNCISLDRRITYFRSATSIATVVLLFRWLSITTTNPFVVSAIVLQQQQPINNRIHCRRGLTTLRNNYDINHRIVLWMANTNGDVNGESSSSAITSGSSSSSSSSSSSRSHSKMIDIEDIVDPEFVDRKQRFYLDNYDNDFDAAAFTTIVPGSHSCVVDYDTMSGGLAIPFITNYESDSTWIEYGPDGCVALPAGPIGQFKENLANMLKEPRVEVIISFSVLMSCALVAISTFENFPYRDALLFIEDFITAIFAVDFFGRWFSSSRDYGRHILNPQFALDVMVVVLPLVFALVPNVDKSTLPLPDWMTSPSTLINLELLRVLRLRRVFQDMNTYTTFERALGIRNVGVQLWQLQLARVVFSLFTLLSVSTGLIYSAEHDVNPAIPDYFTALYFSISTLATLGLGDITPITWQGRLVVCAAILAGVAIVPAQAAALVDALVSRRDAVRETSRRPSKVRQQVKGTRAGRSNYDDDRPSLLSSPSFIDEVDDTDSNGLYGGRLILEVETSFQCPNCGSTMHWSSARYCWSCGSKLS
jgi:voltage-gated potassium channel Kch